MGANNQWHDALCHALEQEGWGITRDPLPLVVNPEVKRHPVQGGGDSVVAADRGDEHIAIEVKSFGQDSAIVRFYEALRQYLSDRTLLQHQYPQYVLYLAVPLEIYNSFFSTPLARAIMNSEDLNLIVYNPHLQQITHWINT
ncbi:element excision factor XisH family protein [Prochlorothrix hollandica]|uniref:Fatty-acid oxidation protein subunit alpha n=1 Tax=Prochlorothrix hollandica PCC 9006 = CALU 1027 TaxID=317619 RepID=A0A0M2PSM6_PROHO|nr:element excision factor XisH family protein [Prochlorothrix hollandica]KKI99525.1 hypothetical protein PROH_13140 [Prochlorothrix hollandica PCC 9006 = CALU 1027]